LKYKKSSEIIPLELRTDINNKLSLNNYNYIDKHWSNEIRIQHDRITILVKALNLFFNDEIDEYDYYFQGMKINNVDIKELYESENIKIKLYMNGKVDLRFNDSVKAIEFYKYFRLNEKR